jgi:hypothetical protein
MRSRGRSALDAAATGQYLRPTARGSSSVGRALRSQRRGRGFKSPLLHHLDPGSPRRLGVSLFQASLGHIELIETEKVADLVKDGDSELIDELVSV